MLGPFSVRQGCKGGARVGREHRPGTESSSVCRQASSGSETAAILTAGMDPQFRRRQTTQNDTQTHASHGDNGEEPRNSHSLVPPAACPLWTASMNYSGVATANKAMANRGSAAPSVQLRTSRGSPCFKQRAGFCICF